MVKELDLDVSTEELLSAERAFTYADLYTMVGDGDTIAWLTPDAYVVRPYGRAEDFVYFVDEGVSTSFRLNVDGKELVVDMAISSGNEELSEISDVVLRLLAVSVARSVLVESCSDTDFIISAPRLAYLMEQCQSLKILSFTFVGALNSDHCHVLGAYSRPDLEIILIHCRLTSAGTSALAEVLGRNQGPTKLDYCVIDNLVLAGGLRGNSRLKSLRPRISRNLRVGNQEILEIAGALKENKGLVDLDFRCDLFRDFTMSNETWGAVFDSLKTHPTLEVLNLRAAIMHTNRKCTQIPPSVMNFRIPAILGMVKMNTSIHTIRLESQYYEHELYRESTVPYLETNRSRPRVLAIQKTHPIAYRAKVLGRALLAARTDANQFWMLLSGNPEVAFSSTTATTTPATKLPTLATAAASTTTATTTVATGLPAVNVAAPASGQRSRKACPKS